jgi:hypothetical protein
MYFIVNPVVPNLIEIRQITPESKHTTGKDGLSIMRSFCILYAVIPYKLFTAVSPFVCMLCSYMSCHTSDVSEDVGQERQ